MSQQRILVWGLTNNRAGTEAVIKNYVQLCPEVSFDFLCYEAPVNHAEIFKGSRNRYYVFPFKSKNPWRYFIELPKFIKSNAQRYSTIWVNINDTANIDPLVWAKRGGIKKRIVHMHNSQVSDDPLIQFFSRVNKQRCLESATDYWACSEMAGAFLYGDRSYTVIPNVVHPDNVKYSKCSARSIRRLYGIEDDSFLIGAVGRLSKVKNLEYLLQLLPSLLMRNDKICLLLVGDGELRPNLERLTHELGIENKVFFAGSQKNVADYYSSFDVFVMPSLFEGLPVSLLEAQFNGLPCVVSDAIPAEAVISTDAIRVPLSSEREWIESLLHASRRDNALIFDRADKYTFESCRKRAQKMFLSE